MGSKVIHFAEDHPEKIVHYLKSILCIANDDKEALGFLPHSAYRDAIAQRRLLAMIATVDNETHIAGFLLYSRVFPHARVRQLAVKRAFRRQGLATTMLSLLVSKLERDGFLSLRADVAADLVESITFYINNGFILAKQKPGGSARKRRIMLMSRDLDVPHLFTNTTTIRGTLPIARAKRNRSFFTFDLNVLFDLIKNRKRHDAAAFIFSAGLQHRIRLGIAPELIRELRRKTSNHQNDPILQMALQLPRLPALNQDDTFASMVTDIHDLVFMQSKCRDAGTDQAMSDARHLAHSARAGASAFITSDATILNAREKLLNCYGLDVVTLDELIALLPADLGSELSVPKSGSSFVFAPVNTREAYDFLMKAVDHIDMPRLFPRSVFEQDQPLTFGISDLGGLAAVACLWSPESVTADHRLVIYVDPGHVERALFVDYLLDLALREACAGGPALIRLCAIAGQSVLSAAATDRGFHRRSLLEDFVKFAVGRPLTGRNWESFRRLIQRKTDIILPSRFTALNTPNLTVEFLSDTKQQLTLARERLEHLLGPTIIAWPDREGVLAPIAQSYADDLLGTNRQAQLSFIQSRDAAFASRRAYVNTPRSRNLMRPGRPILFYESSRSGGRGAVVAIGRIVESLLVRKDQTLKDVARSTVVDDLSGFSSSNDVLLTYFDNLLRVPNPIPMKRLKELDVFGRGNLRSTTRVSYASLAALLDEGWGSD